MRRVAIALTSACLLVALADASVAGDEPHRRAGLWRQQLTLDDGSYPIPVSEMCIDAKTEPRLTLVGAQMDRSHCASYGLEKQADGSWSFRSVCRLDEGDASTVTTGSVKGDFETTYSVNATGVTTGTSTPGMDGAHRIVIKATHVGPCPGDMKGGDVRTNGKIRNVFAP